MKTTPPIRDVAVVLPAFNEEKDLPHLLARIRETLEDRPFSYQVVVVDDGSSDGTAKVAESATEFMPLTLVRHGVNRGLGMAIQTGLKAAVKIADAVITMDADNSHDPLYVADLVARLDEGDVDLVIASRFRKGSRVLGVPWYRQALSWGCCLFMKSLVNYKNVRDYSTGFRAYRSSALKEVIRAYGDRLVEESGFVCMLEVLLKHRATGIKAAEVPYTLRYDLKQGVSKMRVFRTIRRYFSVVSRYRKALPLTSAPAASVIHPRSATATPQSAQA